MNHYLTSKFKGEEFLPGPLMDNIMTMFEDQWNISDLEHVRNQLEEVKNKYSAAYESKTLHEQQQARLFYAIEAVWAVEHKTFIDTILKETTEHLMQPRKDWLSTALINNEAIKQAAVEDPKAEQKRHDLKERLSRMNQCMEELRFMRGSGASKKP